MSSPSDLLASLIAPCGVYCPRCSSLVAAGPTAQEGVLSWLPEAASIPRDSCVRAHAEMQRPEAFNHPAVAVLSAACGHVVFCLSLTSFGKRGIAAKQSDRRQAGKIFDVARYAALREPATCAPGQLILDYTGPRLDVQSYVNLQHGWWIEADCLRPILSRRGAKAAIAAADPPCLAPLSLALLTAHFAQGVIDQVQSLYARAPVVSELKPDTAHFFAVSKLMPDAPEFFPAPEMMQGTPDLFDVPELMPDAPEFFPAFELMPATPELFRVPLWTPMMVA